MFNDSFLLLAALHKIKTLFWFMNVWEKMQIFRVNLYHIKRGVQTNEKRKNKKRVSSVQK